MNMKKILSIITIFFMMLYNINAVQVIQSVQKTAPVTNSFAKTIIVWLIGIILFFIFISFLVLIVAWIIIKINKKLSEMNRRKKDILYYNFIDSANQCFMNKDSTLMYRNKWRLWIMYKREIVYARTENDGLVPIGLYNGEGKKKENFFMIGLHYKLGIFRFMDTILLIPNEIVKQVLHKIKVNGRNVLIIDCEGIDSVANTDYYYIPLIKDKKNDTGFLDFSEQVHEKYIEKFVFREVIKEQLFSYKDNMVKAVETNPNIHIGRRKQE